jgi:putative intracellular protease/amidase
MKRSALLWILGLSLVFATVLLGARLTGATAQPSPTPTLMFTMPELPTLAPPPTVAPATDPQPPTVADAGLPNGRGGGVLVFGSDRAGDEELYLVNADGSQLRRLTVGEGSDYAATFSPDGTQIAFSSDRDGDFDIYVMDTNGDNLRQLTDSPGMDVGGPTWSPDGTQIAFVSGRDGDMEIFVINVDGSGERQLTDNDAEDWWPAWSPDGKQIAFNSDRDGNTEIYMMNADGSDPRNVTQHDANDWNPDWSPDGTQIVFASNRDGDDEITIVNADGSGLQQVTDNNVDDWNPAWSPDGTQIAFVSYRDQLDGDIEVYVMNVDGSGVQRVTRSPTHDELPDWMPGVSPPETEGTILIIFGSQFIYPIIEVIVPAFEEAGYEVLVASDGLSPVRAKDHNVSITPDMLLEDVVVGDYDAIVFSCDNDITFGSAIPQTNRIAQDAVAQGKVLAAICSGPRILAYAQVVEGLEVTGEPSRTCRMLEEQGGICTRARVQRDGLIITALDRYSSREFAQTILEVLHE